MKCKLVNVTLLTVGADVGASVASADVGGDCMQWTETAMYTRKCERPRQKWNCVESKWSSTFELDLQWDMGSEESLGSPERSSSRNRD